MPHWLAGLGAPRSRCRWTPSPRQSPRTGSAASPSVPPNSKPRSVLLTPGQAYRGGDTAPRADVCTGRICDSSCDSFTLFRGVFPTSSRFTNKARKTQCSSWFYRFFVLPSPPHSPAPFRVFSPLLYQLSYPANPLKTRNLDSFSEFHTLFVVLLLPNETQ